MTNLDSILKNRNIALQTKVYIVKAMFFSNNQVWIWELDHKNGWVPKNWCLWTVALEKILKSPLECKIEKVVLKETSPEYSLEGLRLKLTLQYFGHLMQGVDSLEKTLMLEKIEGRKRRGWQRMIWLDGITDSMDMSLIEQALRVGDGQRILACYSPWGFKKSDTTEQLNWIDQNAESEIGNQNNSLHNARVHKTLPHL